MKHSRHTWYLILPAVILCMRLLGAHGQPLPPVPHEIARADFESAGKTYSVELEPQKGAELGAGEEGSGYCGNPDGSPELRSDCDLVLKEGKTELSRTTLDECGFVYRHEKWLAREIAPLEIFKRKGDFPLIYVSQYAGCNGNLYYFFWIEAQKDHLVIRPVSFIGFPYTVGNNQLWADPSEGSVRVIPSPRSKRYEIWAKGYDNSGLFSFIAQYGEISPGQWQCIGLYTEAGGSYGTMKKKIFKK
jgi:hypothetical protein